MKFLNLEVGRKEHLNLAVRHSNRKSGKRDAGSFFLGKSLPVYPVNFPTNTKGKTRVYESLLSEYQIDKIVEVQTKNLNYHY